MKRPRDEKQARTAPSKRDVEGRLIYLLGQLDINLASVIECHSVDGVAHREYRQIVRTAKADRVWIATLLRGLTHA